MRSEGSLVAEAARLDELRLEAQEERIGALLAIGAAARAIGDLEPLVARHPLRERFWEQLMLALYRDGRQGQALEQFQRAREVLADELGIDPSPELARLHGQILTQDPSLELRGEPLRGYRLLEKVGESRDAIRFRAIQPRVERDVEITLIHEHIAASAAFAGRFEPEAQAVASLEHPHIVPMYDYWREPSRAYIVTRYLRGPSLDSIVEADELPTDRALLLLEQVASALAFAHREGVVHGALDADAIRSDTEGNAYLGGFSIGAGPTVSTRHDLDAFEEIIRTTLRGDIPGPLADLLDGGSARDATTYAEMFRSLRGVAAAITPPSDRAIPNPFRGLRAFTEHDAVNFFGRASAVRDVLGSLAETRSGRLVAVVGPSGCGKSSLVAAGVVPAVRRGDADEPVLVATLTPGAHPFDELASALHAVAVRSVPRLGDDLQRSSRGVLDAVERAIPGTARVVLVVDQFEELFTLTGDEAERAAFLECLRVACAEPGGRIAAVVTLRADFYDRPLGYARFGELLAANTLAVAPLQADELEQAITSPCARVGVSLEPGLVGEIVADAAHQPGALPLVQFALTALFDRRTDEGLTVAAYRELGGIVGTIATSAEDALRQASPQEQRAARQVLLRLVTLGEGQADTRRRVRRSELDALDLEPTTVDALLDRFGRLRLLTFDRDAATREPTVEIAHEALLGAWPRLRTWIDAAREDLRQERALGRAAREWEAGGREPSFLLRGARLDHAETWVDGTDLVIPQEVHRFVRAGVHERDREEHEAARRLEYERAVERRSSHRLRALVAVFAAAALVAGSLTLVATSQRRRASEAQQLAAIRELAAASVANLEADPELAVLLAVEGVERSRALGYDALFEAEESLHRAIASSRIIATMPGFGDQVAVSETGMIAALRLDQPGEVGLLDGSGGVLKSFAADDGAIADLAFAGDLLLTLGEQGALHAWDVRSGRQRWHIRRAAQNDPEDPNTLSLDSVGRLVAVSWPAEQRILLMDARSGLRVHAFKCSKESCQASLSPDGRRIAVVNVISEGVVGGWIGPAMRQGSRVPFSAPVNAGINGRITWSGDGRYLSGSAFVWSARTGHLLHTAEHGYLASSSAWSSDGRLVTGSGGTARVWRVSPHEFSDDLTLSALGGTQAVNDVAFVPEGDQVVTASEDAVRIWDVRPWGDVERASLPVPTEYFGDLAFAGTRTVIVRSDDPKTTSKTRLQGWDIAAERSRWLPSLSGPSASELGLSGPSSFDVDPIEGSVLVTHFDGSVGVLADGSIRRLPIDANPAGWGSDAMHVVVSRGPNTVALLTLDGTPVWRLDLPLPIGLLWIGPHGEIAVAAGDADPADDRVVLLDPADGSIISTLTVPAQISGLAFDPRGHSIVTSGVDGSPLEAWDTATGERIGTYPHETGGTSFTFSPDGSQLAATGDDLIVHLYDTDTRKLTMRLPAPQDMLGTSLTRADGDFRCYVRNLAFNTDGSLLAAQGCAGVHVFALDVDELLAIAHENVTRPFTDEECLTYLHRPCSA
jgi:WD40 repeat protein